MDDKSLRFAELKTQHREIRDELPQCLSLRIDRALSWLNCAEQHEGDLDSEFIFLPDYPQASAIFKRRSGMGGVRTAA